MFKVSRKIDAWRRLSSVEGAGKSNIVKMAKITGLRAA
jgi:hypothetical protein